MSVINRFNGLGGAVVTRQELEDLRSKAIQEENEEIVFRISKLLEKFPDIKNFELEEHDCYVVESVPIGYLHGLDFEPSQDEQQGLGKVSPTEVYDLITAKIVKMIEAVNASDYQKKWTAQEYGTGYTVPFNFVTKKRYRGVNVLMLTELEPLENPFFLTFKQVKELKGKVKKGAKGHEVVYFTHIYKTEDRQKDLRFSSYDKKKVESFAAENSIDKELGVIPMLKYYHVYNGKDIEGIDFGLDKFKIGFIDIEKPSTEANKLAIPEAIVKNYPAPQPSLKFGGDRAFYSPGKDHIQMPYLADFETVQDYYRTLLHEYSHSTGASKRLARDFSGTKGSKKYAFEELVAELGAIFLSAEAGIVWHNNKNHAAYLKGWNSVLTQIKEDNKFIMKASTAAQKVADFVLQFDEKGDPLYFKDLEKELKKTVAKDQKKTKEKDNNYPFSENDIPYETAYRAYTGISFSPEKRAVSEQKGYFEFMKSVYDENLIIATNNNKEELFRSNFETFQKGYLKRSLDHLRSKHGIFSSMIAGPAKFPVARMEKKNRIANDKLNELIKFGEMGQKRLLQSITPEAEKPIKTGAKGTLEILKEKLTEAESIHKKNLDGNKLLKKLRASSVYELQDLIEGLINIGFTEEKAKSEANYMFKNSYAGFSTTNSNAKVKRIKDQKKTKNIDPQQTSLFGTKPKTAIQTIKKGDELQYLDNNTKVASINKFGVVTWHKKGLTAATRNRIRKDAVVVGLAAPMFEEVPEEIPAPGPETFYSPTPVIPIIENSPVENVFTDENEESITLASPVVQPIEEKVNLPLNRNSLAYRRQNRSNSTHEYYTIDSPDISEFLGQIEKKKKESVAITIAGGQGSGKTSFVFQLMNAFAKNYKVGHASIEEHPESALYENKAERFWNEKAKATIDSPEINSMQDIHDLIMRNDVIVIDSFSKLLSMDNKISLDETFRKKYDGKLFVIIYQLTTDGKMRGGSSSQFDGDVILFVEKFPDFADNYVYADKNRYQNRSLDDLHYNIASAKLTQPETEEIEKELVFTEEIERI